MTTPAPDPEHFKPATWTKHTLIRHLAGVHGGSFFTSGLTKSFLMDWHQEEHDGREEVTGSRDSADGA